MTDRPRYVLDSNVMVSGLLFPGSLPGQAFTQARSRGDILLSNEIVEELIDVLRRPKFVRYVLREERDRFLAALIHQARLVLPTERVSVCRDPKDDKWLELALSGNANCLVSGDNDLLTLDGYRGITIVAPALFVASLKD
jgi:uncharacterized protein